MLYELRVYELIRESKEGTHYRFENYTVPLFKKHGFRIIGFWETIIGPNTPTLTYILQWTDLNERQAKFDAFFNDPEWIEALRVTAAGGPYITRIHSSIMTPTKYSPLQ